MTKPKYDYEGIDVQVPDSTELASLSTLVQQLIAEDRAVVEAEAKLKAAKMRQADLSDKRIPELMEKLRMQRFTTSDGFEVTVKKTLRASIPAAPDKAEAAVKWLLSNGHSGVLKRQLTVEATYSEEDREHIKAVQKLLADNKFEFTDKLTVHPNTLSALLREEMEEGVVIPMETFNAFEQAQTKVKKLS
jgi:hypothetical protein